MSLTLGPTRHTDVTCLWFSLLNSQSIKYNSSKTNLIGGTEGVVSSSDMLCDARLGADSKLKLFRMYLNFIVN